MKTLLLLMLFSITAYSAPKLGDDNPGNADPPNDNCAFCGDDEPEPEAPLPHGLWWFAAGVLFMKMYNSKNK